MSVDIQLPTWLLLYQYLQSSETRKLHLGGNSLLLIRCNQRAAGLAKIEFTLALRAATASFGACAYLLAPCAARVIIRAAFLNAF